MGAGLEGTLTTGLSGEPPNDFLRILGLGFPERGPRYGGDQRSRSASVAMLAQVDPLPGPEYQSPARHGQRQRRPQQRRLDMRGHVIGPLERVRPIAGPLRNRLVEPGFEVP